MLLGSKFSLNEKMYRTQSKRRYGKMLNVKFESELSIWSLNF